MPINKPLDPEFVKTVLELAKEMNGHQIAKHLNLDKNRVWYVLKKYKVTPKRSHHRPIDEVLKVVRYSRLHGQRAAMKEFGLTKHQVSRCHIRYKKIEKSFIDRAPALRQSAIAHAMVKANMRREIAEEFASYCVERFITKQKNIFFDTAYVDFMRERHGRSSSASATGEASTHSDLNSPEPSENMKESDIYGLLPKNLNGLIVALVYKYGFSMNEIGVWLDCTESAISQRIGRTLERIKSRYGKTLEEYT